MKIHFIGISGVAMSAIAIALHKIGHEISGSDKGFYPPISTHLQETSIRFYAGFHIEKMLENGQPDLVVVGNVAGSKNEEFNYVKEKNIQFLSYPEAIQRFFIKENSIVVSGTFGKTTTTALLAYTLKRIGTNPSYMFGGLLQQKGFLAAEINDGKYSVLEGDEYKTAPWDNRPKFKLYDPTHLVLTGVVWDHADIYKTEESYFQEFYDLMDLIPNNGLIVACTDHEGTNKVLDRRGSQLVTYGKNISANYRYGNIEETKDGLKFKIFYENSEFEFKTKLIGEYLAENITGAFALLHQLGNSSKQIIPIMQSFPGMKRRLEKRFENENCVIFDDIAHSAEKVKSLLKTIKKNYSDRNITIVFEPNTGNRQDEAILSYNDAFKNAETVIVPKLSVLKQGEGLNHMDGENLKNVISKTHKNTIYVENDTELIDILQKTKQEKSVIVFAGSHGFRGMIEEISK